MDSLPKQLSGKDTFSEFFHVYWYTHLVFVYIYWLYVRFY